MARVTAGAVERSEAPAADALAEVRALVGAEAVLEVQLRAAVVRARAMGVDSFSLAHALGVHRATLYRRFPIERAAEGET